jgi:outer membrane lipoprotein-sorting protein
MNHFSQFIPLENTQWVYNSTNEEKLCYTECRSTFVILKGGRGSSSADCQGDISIMRKRGFIIFGFIFLGFFLSGCPKKMPEPMIIEKPSIENPMVKLLEIFSSAESLQAKASIRIDLVRNGQEMNFLLNGIVLYQKPDRFRLLGYHPLGTGLFDALYENGEFFLLIPFQKTVYTGEVSKFGDMITEAGPIQISTEKAGGNPIPNRIRIEVVEKEIRIDLRLKEISLNSSLPEDSFQWMVPEGVKIKPLDKLLRKRLQ